MSTDDSEPPYDVGYCKPPVKHRFAKGKSGNPRGRSSKPVRSLTRRQLFTDPIKLGEKLVKVKRQGKTAMVPLIEVVWEGMATKAANGHGPSQRFFIKHYMLSIEQLHKHHSEFLRTIERFQADAANTSQGEISPDDHEQLNHYRRRSHQLIGQYDSKKDPYVKKQARKSAAATARRNDRTSRGIQPAEAEALDTGLRVYDPADGRQLMIDPSSYGAVHRMLQAQGSLTPADLGVGLCLGGESYDEIVDQLKRSDVGFQEGF